jgi:CheY-like chemotaxis protein
MLQNTNLNKKQSGFLEIIQVSSNNLVSIITDILDFSKIEAGEIQLDYQSFNIKKELERNLKALSLKAEEKGLELGFHELNDIPDYIIGDIVRIKQVFINLVSNAIKFTSNGFVKVLLEYDYKDEKIKVLVKDSGIGIASDKLDKIFSAFSQTDGSITRKFGGTGLGLTISKDLVELMEGHIEVKSELGKGSAFSFSIPAKTGKVPLSSETKPVKIETKHLKLNILLAEDNLINQKVAKAIFTKIGYTIDIANNGKEAIEMYKNKNHEIIFMDIQMPVMDGITATKQINKVASLNNKKVFITAMTANASKEDKEKCMDSGMQYFLSKPYKPENIEEVIAKYIEINQNSF